MSKLIVENNMKGTIEVETSNSNTIFTLTIPLMLVHPFETDNSECLL